MKPKKITGYECPECNKYIGKNLIKAKEHVNQPRDDLPIGLVYFLDSRNKIGGRNITCYSVIIGTELFSDHTSRHRISFVVIEKNPSQSAKYDLYAKQIRKYFADGQARLLSEDEFENFLDKYSSIALKRLKKVNKDSLIRSTPKLEDLV